MPHTNLKLGDKHINVLLDSLRSYIANCDNIVNLNPNRLHKKQLKYYNNTKANQHIALEIVMRISDKIKPKKLQK